jgi:hypothetical protein
VEAHLTKPETRVVYVKSLTTAQKKKFATDQRRLFFELGKLIHAWSLLHEWLAGIFQQATECPPHVSNAMWHSLKSDLAQRELLLAALRSSSDLLQSWTDDEKKQQKLLVFSEYIWIVQEITKFSHRRNDLIHSPIMFYLASEATEYEAIVSDIHGNPRARVLKDKELYQLCRWMISFCENMNGHIHAIWRTVKATGKLPERPKIKPLSDFPTRKQKPVRARRRFLKRAVKKSGRGP